LKMSIDSKVQSLEKASNEVVNNGPSPKKIFLSRILTILGAIILIALITILKFVITGFSWALYAILVVLILVAGTLIIILPTILKGSDKSKDNKDELPKPASLAELESIAERALTNKHFANHLRGCDGYGFVTLAKSKNQIFYYKSKALYTSGMKEGIVYVLINAHYPQDRKTILIDPNVYQLNQAIKNLGTVTEDELPMEEMTTRNEGTGIVTQVRKPYTKEERERIKKDKEEDLE